MTKKVLAFIAGRVPTSQEAAAIAKFNSLVAAPYEVVVMNVNNTNGSTGYGEGRPVPADGIIHVGATIPAEYLDEDDEPIYTVIDPDNIPVGFVLEPTQAVVKHDQVIAGTGGSFKVTVVNGVITGGVWTAA